MTGSRNILSPWARHRQVRCRDIEISNTAGRTTTNALFLDIDGTVTRGLYIDNDGTMTNAIRIDSVSGKMLTMASSEVPLVVASGTIPLELYTTTSDTSSTVTSGYIKLVHTANTRANQIEAFIVEVESEYETGDWCNAIVARLDYGTTGDAAGGMAAPLVSELNYGAHSYGSGGGQNYVLDLEMNCPTNFVCDAGITAHPQAFLNIAIWGGATAIGTWEDYGFFFRTDGFDAAAGNIISVDSNTVRCRLEDDSGDPVSMYMLFSTAENCLTMAGTPASHISLTGAASSSAISITGAEAIGISIATSTPTSGIAISAVCADGIKISGACTDGIEISGACTTGINFSGTGTKNITMGTTGGSGSTTALGTLSASWYGIEMSVSANCAGNEAHAIRAEIETTAGTAGNIMCGRFDAVATESVNTLNGINATAQLNDDLTIGGRVAAGYISLYGASGKTLTRTANSIYALFVQHLLNSDPGAAPNPAGAGGVADFYNAAVGISMPSGTYCDYGVVIKGETNGTVAAILIGPHGTTTWENGIRFSNGSPGDAGSTVDGGITSALYFDSQCPITNFSEWEAAAGPVSSETGATFAGDGVKIAIDVAGTTYYLRACTSFS